MTKLASSQTVMAGKQTKRKTDKIEEAKENTHNSKNSPIKVFHASGDAYNRKMHTNMRTGKNRISV